TGRRLEERRSAHGTDERGGVGVELVELEAAGVVVRAVALQDPVSLPVVEHRAVLDARRGPDRPAGEVAQFDDRAESLGDGAALPVAAVVAAHGAAEAAGRRGDAARLGVARAAAPHEQQYRAG